MARPRSTPQGVGLASLTLWLSVITLMLMVEFILLQAVAVGITTVVYSLIPTLGRNRTLTTGAGCSKW